METRHKRTLVRVRRAYRSCRDVLGVAETAIHWLGHGRHIVIGLILASLPGSLGHHLLVAFEIGADLILMMASGRLVARELERLYRHWWRR
jgi:hypothetical protein